MMKTGQLQSPVLFIIFNRPELTRRVFAAIREARPTHLYIAADGPRQGVATDVANCNAARQIINEVDWDCDVQTLFQDRNLNCGVGPATAISWFFRHEKEGIIVEDDCLPTQSFFWFCQDLLDRYRHDTRIMHIGGNNFLDGWIRDPDYSYYFSRSGHVWGWATWRRAWKKFDFKIERYPQLKAKGFFRYFFLNPFEKMYRLRKFDRTFRGNGAVNWWDYQWDFARYSNNGLAIVPDRNLVENIGFGKIGTHTRNSNTKAATLKATDIDFPLRHPPFVLRDVTSDKRYFHSLMKDVIQSKIKNMMRPLGINN